MSNVSYFNKYTITTSFGMSTKYASYLYEADISGLFETGSHRGLRVDSAKS
jgi:hypothetical protein